MIMKRFAAFIMILVLALSLLASCGDYADYPDYENITYKEEGLELTLRNDMRRTETENYVFYFSNLAGTAALAASKVTAKQLEDEDLAADATAGEFVNCIIEQHELDRDRIYYSHDESRANYSFRYTVGEEGENGIFYYVVVLGDPGNIWYVEMMCSESDSGLYVSRFDAWKNSLRVYNE